LSFTDQSPETRAPRQSGAGKDVLARPGRRLVLAIDSALGACAATVYDAGLWQTLAVQSYLMSRGHAEVLMPMIERVMHDAGISFDRLDRVVTTTGPGSFTGVRIGIAAARGLALASGKPAIGVSTLDALSAPHVSETETVPVVAAIDAKHGSFFLQMTGANGRVLVTPRVASLQDALRSTAIGLVRIIGSGADQLATHWPPDVPAPLLVDPLPAPDIVWVARLGAKAYPDKTALPRPLYLRAPDARPQDAQRLARR
jgi:tRNA threonylcarbamoyladenosine biosynthesis protein TsaB